MQLPIAPIVDQVYVLYKETEGNLRTADVIIRVFWVLRVTQNGVLSPQLLSN
jgi:hypothetical protein